MRLAGRGCYNNSKLGSPERSYGIWTHTVPFTIYWDCQEKINVFWNRLIHNKNRLGLLPDELFRFWDRVVAARQRYEG